MARFEWAGRDLSGRRLKLLLPTRELLPIAGLIAFYNEKVDITLDGRLLARPVIHFS